MQHSPLRALRSLALLVVAGAARVAAASYGAPVVLRTVPVISLSNFYPPGGHATRATMPQPVCYRGSGTAATVAPVTMVSAV